MKGCDARGRTNATRKTTAEIVMCIVDPRRNTHEPKPFAVKGKQLATTHDCPWYMGRKPQTTNGRIQSTTESKTLSVGGIRKPVACLLEQYITVTIYVLYAGPWVGNIAALNQLSSYLPNSTCSTSSQASWSFSQVQSTASASAC